MNIASESFSERRTALLSQWLSRLPVRPGGMAHAATAADEAAATQHVMEAMLDEIHFMLRMLTRR